MSRFGAAGSGQALVKSEVVGAQTDSALVTAATGERIVVDFLAVSADGAGTFVLNSKPSGAGTAIVSKKYLAANGGFIYDLAHLTNKIATSLGEGMTFTTTGAGVNFSVDLVYHLEP